jgi:hypothetical protein
MAAQTFPYSKEELHRWLDQSMELLQNTLRKIAGPVTLGIEERKSICHEVSVVASVVTHLGQQMLCAARQNPERIPDLPFGQTPEILEMLQDIDRALAEVCAQLEIPPVWLN